MRVCGFVVLFLDQIRKMDWIPRSVRQRQRKIDEAMKQIEMRTGKTASD